MSADNVFLLITYMALPAVILYPLIYGLTSPWWKSWLGRALLIKAVGILVLVLFIVFFNLFGPSYWGREGFRIGGMAFICVGCWTVLFAMLDVKYGAKHRAWLRSKFGTKEGSS